MVSLPQNICYWTHLSCDVRYSAYLMRWNEVKETLLSKIRVIWTQLCNTASAVTLITQAATKWLLTLYFKCLSIHGNTAQIADFILWIVPKHLSQFCGKCGSTNHSLEEGPQPLSSRWQIFQNQKTTHGANHHHLEQMLFTIQTTTRAS